MEGVKRDTSQAKEKIKSNGREAYFCTRRELYWGGEGNASKKSSLEHLNKSISDRCGNEKSGLERDAEFKHLKQG